MHQAISENEYLVGKKYKKKSTALKTVRSSYKELIAESLVVSYKELVDEQCVVKSCGQ